MLCEKLGARVVTPEELEIAVPRARLNISGGKTTEWKSQVLRNYQRRTRAADALIAGGSSDCSSSSKSCQGHSSGAIRCTAACTL